MRSHLRCIPHLDGSFTKSSLSIFFLSSLLGVYFILTIFMNTNSQTQITTTNCKMMLCNDFPHWWEGYCALLHMIPSCQWGKSLHSIISRFMVVIWICEFVFIKMSWAKQLAEAGLAGLTEREAARGVLCEEAFQFMPTPHVRHVIVVSKFKSRLILHVLNLQDIKDKYLQSTVYLI